MLTTTPRLDVGEMVTIKKYDNRRLYDTSASRYITLDELAAKIRAGTEVRVVRADSGEEITQRVLAQIILESRGAARLLPVPLLTRLIRMGDDQLAEFFGQYMSWALEFYLQLKDRAEQWTRYNPFSDEGLAGPELVVKRLIERLEGSESPERDDELSAERESPAFDVRDVEPVPEADEDLPDRDETTHEEETNEDGADGAKVEQLRREIDELKEMVRTMQEE